MGRGRGALAKGEKALRGLPRRSRSATGVVLAGCGAVLQRMTRVSGCRADRSDRRRLCALGGGRLSTRRFLVDAALDHAAPVMRRVREPGAPRAIATMNERGCRRRSVRECLWADAVMWPSPTVSATASLRPLGARSIAPSAPRETIGDPQRLAAPASRLSLPRTWCTGSPNARAFETRSCFSQREAPSGSLEMMISS